MRKLHFHIPIGFFLLLCFLSEAWGQVYPVKSNRKWGLIDRDGRVVAPPQFDAVHLGKSDRAVVVLAGKYGLVDVQGRELIAPQYTFLREVGSQLVLINQGGDCQEGDCSGGKWGLVHLGSGRVLEPAFSRVGSFERNGLARVNVGGNCHNLGCKDGLWGLVDTLAQVILPAQYSEILLGRGPEVFVKNEEGWGIYLLDSGRVTLPNRFASLQRISPERLVASIGDGFGVVDNQGNFVVAPRYQDIEAGGEDGYLSFAKNFLYGLMDSVGNEVVPARYESVRKLAGPWVLVRSAGRWGLRNLRDEELMDCVLALVDSVGPNYAVVQRGPLWGAIDSTGREIVPIRFQHAAPVNDSLFRVRHGEYLKWVNREGKVIQARKVDEVGPFEDGAAWVRDDGKEGLLGISGNWLFPPRYAEVNVFRTVAQARMEGSSEWEYLYFTRNGFETDARSFIVIKREEERQQVPLGNSAGVMGWFFNTARQLWGLRSPGTGKILIQPTYTRVSLVPGTDFTMVQGSGGIGTGSLWGIVNHRSGEQIHDPAFASIEEGDFARFGVARATYSSGRYALILPTGRVANFEQAAYIGRFSDGVARINLGGNLAWRSTSGVDTLYSDVYFDDVERAFRTRYRVCEGGKWGFINLRGEWVKDAQYEMVSTFRYGTAGFVSEGKWGLLDRQFAEVIPPRYDLIDYLQEGELDPLVVLGLEQDGYGFIDSLGELAISPRFAEVGDFHNGRVRVASEGQWGFADREGNLVVQPQYREAGDFHEDRARVRDKRYWGFVDPTGQPVTGQQYLRAGDFHEGVAWVQAGKFFGFIGPDGNFAIDPEFSKVRDFENGMAPARRKGKWGMIDHRGNWVVAPRYYRIGPFVDSVAVIQEGGDWGLIDAHGEFIFRPQFRELRPFHEGLALARKGLEFGYVNPNGEVAIDFQFSRAEDFSCGRAAVFERGRWGFVDSLGQWVVPARYSKVNNFSEDRAAVRINGRWGFIDPTGRLAVPAIYSQVRPFKDGRAAVQGDNGWGLINADGTVVVEPEYDEVGEFVEGLIPVSRHGKWGLLNIHGAPMTMLKYDELGAHHEGLARMLVARRYGVATLQGRVLLEPAYDVVKTVKDAVQVERSDQVGYLNREGRWLWPLQN